jgi:hypothetical protein
VINNDLLGIKQITVDKVSSPNDFIVFTDDYYVPAENLTNISFSVKVAKIQIKKKLKLRMLYFSG